MEQMFKEMNALLFIACRSLYCLDGNLPNSYRISGMLIHLLRVLPNPGILYAKLGIIYGGIPWYDRVGGKGS